VRCPEVSPLVQPWADGELPAADRGLLEEHVASCPSCRRETARVRDNGAFLQEMLQGFRLPGNFDRAFLFRLPRKSARAVAAAAAAAPAPAAGTTVITAAPARGGSPAGWIAGAVLVALVAGLAWWFGSGEEDRPADGQGRPAPIPRSKDGKGPADARPVPLPGTKGPGPAGVGPKPPVPGGGEAAGGPAARTAEDLIRLLRKGGRYGPVVAQGWSILAASAAEAARIREALAKETAPEVRAALALLLGASKEEANLEALRGLLRDGSALVRQAAILGLARALSLDSPVKQRHQVGPPLSFGVEVGAMGEAGGVAEFAGLLGGEPDAGVRATLFQVLGASAATEATARQRLLDALKGDFGDELRDEGLKGLQGVKEATLPAALAELLREPTFPKRLQQPVLALMLEADRVAASEALAGIVSGIEDADLRRHVLDGVASGAGKGAEKALLDALSGDAEAGIRSAAAAHLARYPTEETLAALEKASEHDENQGVRETAARSLEQVRRVLEARKQETPHEEVK